MLLYSHSVTTALSSDSPGGPALTGFIHSAHISFIITAVHRAMTTELVSCSARGHTSILGGVFVALIASRGSASRRLPRIDRRSACSHRAPTCRTPVDPREAPRGRAARRPARGAGVSWPPPRGGRRRGQRPTSQHALLWRAALGWRSESC